MPDYGGSNDGRCEFSWFERCTNRATVRVRFGQQGGWEYAYCDDCAGRVLHSHEDARLLPFERSSK